MSLEEYKEVKLSSENHPPIGLDYHENLPRSVDVCDDSEIYFDYLAQLSLLVILPYFRCILPNSVLVLHILVSNHTMLWGVRHTIKQIEC